jgi:hypothetical protein
MPLASFYVIGFPGEKKENIERTLSFAENLFKAYRVIPHLGVAAPLKGTRLYSICKENGYLISESYSKNKKIDSFGLPVIKTDDFDPDDLKKYIRQFYKKIFTIHLFLTITNPKAMAVSAIIFMKNPKPMINILKVGKDYI